MRHELSDAAHHLGELTEQLQQTQRQAVGGGVAGRSGELQGKVNQLERALEAEREQRKQVHNSIAAVGGLVVCYWTVCVSGWASGVLWSSVCQWVE